MRRLKEKQLFKQRRTWMIIGAIIMVALGAGLVVFGVTSQQGIFTTTDQQLQEAKSLGAAAFSTSSSSGERRAAIKHLTEINLEGSCRGEWWNGWQQSVLPTLKKAGDECERNRQRLGAVFGAARQVQEYLQYDSAIAQQIASLAITNTKQNWQQTALKSAQKAHTTIKGIRTPEGGKSAQKAALDRLDAIIKSWNLLNAASAKQDKAAYLNAEIELKQAYANLGAVADASDAEVLAMLGRLKKEASGL